MNKINLKKEYVPKPNTDNLDLLKLCETCEYFNSCFSFPNNCIKTIKR